MSDLEFSNGDGRGEHASCFIIERAAFNQGENAQYDFKIAEGGRNAHTCGKGTTRDLWLKVGALCATDYKWVQQEQVEQGKIIPVLDTMYITKS